MGSLSLTIPTDVFDRLDSYIKMAEGEVLGFGLVTQSGPTSFILDEVFLVEQEAGFAHVDVPDEAMHRMVTDLVEAGRGSELERLYLWWHSHGRLDPFLSKTDLDTIERLGTVGDYIISVVGNKMGGY